VAVAGWSAWFLIRRAGPVRGPRTLLALGALLTLCTVAALVNPFGADLPRVWIYVLFGMHLPGYIMEHARLDPTHLHGIIVLLAGAAYAAALAATWPHFPRVTWLLPLVWLLQACLRIRNSPLFAIAALLALADFLPYLRCAPWLARRTDLYGPQPEGQEPARLGWRPLVLPAAAVGLALLLQVSGARVPVVGAGWARLDPAIWPVDLVPQLRALESPGGTPVYNEFIDGGFLIYHTPGLRVFNDDRCELYGEPWQREQLGIVYGRPEEMETLVRAYPFRHALVRNNQPLQEYLEASRDWEVLGRGRIATLYRYRGEPVHAVARCEPRPSGSGGTDAAP
jgi:hypothetical protein